MTDEQILARTPYFIALEAMITFIRNRTAYGDITAEQLLDLFKLNVLRGLSNKEALN